MVPRKMRDEAGVKLFILKGYEGSLSVYKASEFEKLVDKLQELSYTQKNSRDFIRATLGSACELEVDKQGRIQTIYRLGYEPARNQAPNQVSEPSPQ